MHDQEVTMRPSRRQDQEAIQQLIGQILEGEFGYEVNDELRPDLYQIEDHFWDRGGGFWVAEHGGQIIGCIGLALYEGQRGYVQRTYLLPEWRNKGIGNQMLQRLIDFARAREYRELYLGTVPEMEAAIHLYTKAGFEEVEKLPVGIPPFDDHQFFQLRLP